jgi:hypothetical protein
MNGSGGRRLNAVDAAMVQLVRLVLDDAWAASTAAAQLRERVPNDSVLRRVRSRVAAALTDRASDVGERALVTLDLALSVRRDPVDGERRRSGLRDAEVAAG